MKITQLVLASLCVLCVSRVAAADLTGQWAGLMPDGLTFQSDQCDANLLLDLAENASTLSGSVPFVQQVVTGQCVSQVLWSSEITTGQRLPSRVVGTVGPGTVSFNIIIALFFNNTPVAFSAVVTSGTFTPERLATTGTFVPKRAWVDTNSNGIPDCDLLTPTANGECGVLTNPMTTAITLVATAGPTVFEDVTFTGNVLVPTSQNLVCINGGITGNVTIKGGGLLLHNCAVGGDVQISGGSTFSLGPSTSVGNNLVVQKIPSGPAVNQVCDTTIGNDVQFHDNGTTVQLGSATGCPGNSINNNLDVHNNTAVAEIYNNIVGNDLKANNNTAGPQIYYNAVANNLQCSGNVAQLGNSIVGGGNTAKKKQGQCAAF